MDGRTSAVVIVEGKRDRQRLLPLLREDVKVLCTFGIPSPERLAYLVDEVQSGVAVFLFTDNDHVGKRIRGILRDEFPDAIHLHTKIEYGGVETTPLDYLEAMLIRHELHVDSSPPE